VDEDLQAKADPGAMFAKGDPKANDVTGADGTAAAVERDARMASAAARRCMSFNWGRPNLG
jgi:hypothetical protein